MEVMWRENKTIYFSLSIITGETMHVNTFFLHVQNYQKLIFGADVM
jgi:hypothetical protein